MNIFHPTSFESLDHGQRTRIRDVMSVAAAPAALAIVEIFHPHPHQLLDLDVGRWLTVHYLQVPLFALAGFSVAALVRTQAGFPARLCRVALFVFVLCFEVFDTAAGLVVGSLVQVAHASGAPAAWQAPIHTVWTHPILGGANRPLLALIGRVALSVGTIAAGVSLLRAGRPWLPVTLLALSGCVMYVFPSHSWPGGPLTFGGVAMAGTWLQWTRPRLVHGQRKLRSKWIRRPARRGAAQPGQRDATDVPDQAARDPRPVVRDLPGADGAASGRSVLRPHEEERPSGT